MYMSYLSSSTSLNTMACCNFQLMKKHTDFDSDSKILNLKLLASFFPMMCIAGRLGYLG
jgi:hypothetical protein